VDQRDRLADCGISKCTEPATLRGGVGFDPGSDRLDDKDVTEAGDHGFATRPCRSCLCGHQGQDCRQPAPLVALGGSVDVNDFGQRCEQAACCRVPELYDTADDVCGFATSSLTKDCVLPADLVVWQVEHDGGAGSTFVDGSMAGAVGEYGDVARV
jgi:hypothetical protein